MASQKKGEIIAKKKSKNFELRQKLTYFQINDDVYGKVLGILYFLFLLLVR